MPQIDALSNLYHDNALDKVQKKGELSQNDFLKLLVTQINAQDPLNPKEGADFLAQLAQFGVVDGIAKMERSFDQFNTSFQKSQLLSASQLLGHEVFADVDSSLYGENGLLGRFELERPTNIQVQLYDQSNQLVDTIDMGRLLPGPHQFQWTQGEMGELYKVSIHGLDRADGQGGSISFTLAQPVKALSLSHGEMPKLELANGMSVSIDHVKSIK